MSTESGVVASKGTLKAADEKRVTRIGNDYQVETLPAVGTAFGCAEGAGADAAQLVWGVAADAEGAGGEPSTSAAGGGGGGGGAAARFLRQWAAAGLQDAALETLWQHGGRAEAAEAAMASRAQPEAPRAQMTHAAVLGAAIVSSRKDMFRAKRVLAASGVCVSIGELQHFFYGGPRPPLRQTDRQTDRTT